MEQISIFDWSCDTEDWSNDALLFITQINYIYIYLSRKILYYYCFSVFFDQILQFCEHVLLLKNKRTLNDFKELWCREQKLLNKNKSLSLSLSLTWSWSSISLSLTSDNLQSSGIIEQSKIERRLWMKRTWSIQLCAGISTPVRMWQIFMSCQLVRSTITKRPDSANNTFTFSFNANRRKRRTDREIHSLQMTKTNKSLPVSAS